MKILMKMFLLFFAVFVGRSTKSMWTFTRRVLLFIKRCVIRTPTVSSRIVERQKRIPIADGLQEPLKIVVSFLGERCTTCGGYSREHSASKCEWCFTWSKHYKAFRRVEHFHMLNEFAAARPQFDAAFVCIGLDVDSTKACEGHWRSLILRLTRSIRIVTASYVVLWFLPCVPISFSWSHNTTLFFLRRFIFRNLKIVNQGKLNRESTR